MNRRSVMEPNDRAADDPPSDPEPACYYGGGINDHVWMIIKQDDGNCVPEHVGCRDCPAVLSMDELLETWIEHNRIVKTGLSVLTGELDAMRADVEAARGELMVSLDEMPPGSTVRRLMIANRLMARERDEARGKVWDLKRFNEKVSHLIRNGHYNEAQALLDRKISA